MSQGFQQRRQRQIDREHNLEQARRNTYSTLRR
jgi:hypothetical protein